MDKTIKNQVDKILESLQNISITKSDKDMNFTWLYDFLGYNVDSIDIDYLKEVTDKLINLYSNEIDLNFKDTILANIIGCLSWDWKKSTNYFKDIDLSLILQDIDKEGYNPIGFLSLIGFTKNSKYRPIAERYKNDNDEDIRRYALKALKYLK